MRQLTTVLAILLAASVASGQWNPYNGQWGKTEESDVRVVTYNILDHIATIQPKTEGDTSWCALARVIASIKPDVLLLQEAGGTNDYVDSVADLTTCIDLFFHGGTDPFLGGAVTAYVQKYAPGYDLPYVYVNANTDQYNRNVILSRFPFADLNGDNRAKLGDIHYVYPDYDAPDWLEGGSGGIRGFMFAELDLPDETYAGDLVVGNAHLKCCSGSDNLARRLTAAQNVAYYIHYMFNGAGTGMPDPIGNIQDLPQVTGLLDANTPVIYGGDWNEDEDYNGRNGPAWWLTRAEINGGGDGVDRDMSDAAYDYSVSPFFGTRGTYGDGSSKLDYIAWQDSIANLRRSFVFRSNELTNPSYYPPEIVGYPNPQYIANDASDHRPVVADFILPLAPTITICPGDANCDGFINFRDIDYFVAAQNDNVTAWEALFGGAPTCDFLNNDTNADGFVNFRDIDPFVALQNTTCPG